MINDQWSSIINSIQWSLNTTTHGLLLINLGLKLKHNNQHISTSGGGGRSTRVTIGWTSPLSSRHPIRVRMRTARCTVNQSQVWIPRSGTNFSTCRLIPQKFNPMSVPLGCRREIAPSPILRRISCRLLLLLWCLTGRGRNEVLCSSMPAINWIIRVATMTGKAGKAGKLYEYQGIFKVWLEFDIYWSCPLVEFLVTLNFLNSWVSYILLMSNKL